MADAPPAFAVRLAANLEALRRKRRFTQAALARHAGLPRSTVTHLESGAGNPSLGSLARVAAALRVSIEELLAAPRADCALIPAAKLPRSERGHGSAALFRLLPDAIPGLQIERLELAAGGWMRGVPHLEGTKEYLTGVSGETTVSVAGKSFRVGPGDVLAFPGDQPHLYRNPGRGPSVSISIVALVPA